MSFKMPAESS